MNQLGFPGRWVTVLSLLGGVGGGVGWGVPCQAQPERATAPAQPAAPTGEAPEKRAGSESQLINLEFPGGSWMGFVEALRAASPAGAVNVVFGSEEVAQSTVPELSLHRVTALAAIRAVVLSTAVGETSASPGLELASVTDAGSTPVHIVARRPSSVVNPGAGPVVSRAFLVHSLADPGVPGVRPLTLADIAAPLEAALRLSADGKSKPEVLLHERSGLVVVKCVPAQVEMVEAVFAQLKEDIAGARTQLAAARGQLAPDRQRLLTLESLVQRHERSLADAEREAAAAKERGEPEPVQKMNNSAKETPRREILAQQLQSLQEDVDEARQSLRNRQAMFEAAESNWNRLRAGSPAGAPPAGEAEEPGPRGRGDRTDQP